MHARPATLLVNKAGEFKSEIFFEKDRDRVSSKSVLGIIALGLSYDSTLKIIADGEDEQEALSALVELFENKFYED
jgi:phosphocarrier protein